MIQNNFYNIFLRSAAQSLKYFVIVKAWRARIVKHSAKENTELSLSHFFPRSPNSSWTFNIVGLWDWSEGEDEGNKKTDQNPLWLNAGRKSLLAPVRVCVCVCVLGREKEWVRVVELGKKLVWERLSFTRKIVFESPGACVRACVHVRRRGLSAKLVLESKRCFRC